MAAAALAAGAGLAACQRNTPQVAALPLETGPAAPLGEAPPPGGLRGPPARIATLADYHDAYAYPDLAWGMSWAFGNSPPDYAFYDDGVTPWVWVADDDSECLAEPVPGGERYYYFEPGAYTPFYVQDPSYGYGFANGQLVAIYDRRGREVAPTADPTAAATAGQYLTRARLLRQAASSQPHQAVAAANWNARRGLIAAEHAAFARDAAQDPDWRAYHDRSQAQDRARFAGEAARREAWAAQTDTRLGEAARAQREQRLAQSIAQGGVPGAAAGIARGRATQPTVPSQALNPYAEAAPVRTSPAAVHRGPATGPGEQRAQFARPVQTLHQAPSALQARAEHAPRPSLGAPPAARSFAAAPTGRPPGMARAAGEHASDAAFRAGAAAPAPHPAAAPPPQIAQPHVFHAPAAPPAPAAHAPSVPVAHAAPPASPAQHKANGDDKHH